MTTTPNDDPAAETDVPAPALLRVPPPPGVAAYLPVVEDPTGLLVVATGDAILATIARSDLLAALDAGATAAASTGRPELSARLLTTYTAVA